MAIFVVELRYTDEGASLDERRIEADSFTAGEHNYVFVDADGSVLAAMPTRLMRRCIREDAVRG